MLACENDQYTFEMLSKLAPIYRKYAFVSQMRKFFNRFRKASDKMAYEGSSVNSPEPRREDQRVSI